ncbi:MAG TPA: bifunctional demethylmenaquinone methyltransferase/2-methoxy-6-polyprenyl-1,4-benzoquinol methylase UbiE [Pirellulaceae bacterium]|nr:bifunctional demethylmenaquinone methyltransferase/2-methoxy-6-polyprenyl-1,4-benzoquinol methylase UbiE [Pirellulaceae bacterium]
MVDKSAERVREMFGEIAPQYDRLNHLLSFQTDRYWRWRAVRSVRLNDRQPILDCCCGTGDLAFAWSRVTRGRVPVVAAAFCPEMLDVARRKAARFRYGNQVQFVEADTQQLPFETDRFQVVSAAFGLRNVSDTNAGLREMVRVCSPGGHVLILEFTTPRRQPMKGLYLWYFKNVLPRIGERLAKNNKQAYQYLPESVGEFAAYEALLEHMQNTGLTQLRMIPLTFGIATMYLGQKVP